MKKIILVLSMLAAFSAHADDNTNSVSAIDKWTSTEITGEAVIAAEYFIDEKQTLDIKNNPRMHETNILMGKHPSDSVIKRHFAGAYATELLIAEVLPIEYRDFFILGNVALEAVVIGHNKYIGLSSKF